MNTLTAEWVQKAEGDLLTAQRECAAPSKPNFDSVCFHAQQCAEKYLKAVLTEKGISFPKTHDLSLLLRLLLPQRPAWQSLVTECNALTDSAVEVRYPGFSAHSTDAQTALATATQVRNAARQALGLAAV